MKKLVLTSVIVLSQVILYAQCPENIFLSTQEQIDNFQTDYPGCTEIEGSVTISTGYGENITNLNGLSDLTSIGYLLDIYSNDSLSDLTGLDNLTSIGNTLLIYGNPKLTDLSGLGNLLSIGSGFRITSNSNLISFTGLEKLTSIGGHLRLEENASLHNLNGLESVTAIDGYLWIYDSPSLNSLNGLNNVTSLGGINISKSNSLQNFEGLESLVTIEENLVIGELILPDNNPFLTSLDGLNSLVTIGGEIQIGNNDTLSNLNGLNKLTSIGDDLSIIKNRNLINIEGLGSLTTIVPWHRITINNNKSVKSLKGLDNIDAQSIFKLTIAGNDSLSYCEVKSVCDYLAIPGANIIINGNATGCITISQVEKACEASAIEESSTLNLLLIQPNPVNKLTSIVYQLQYSQKVELVIYNQQGQQVYQQEVFQSSGDHQMIWDASDIPGGLYYFVIRIGKESARRKLLVMH